eukprot:gene5277-6115_t
MYSSLKKRYSIISVEKDQLNLQLEQAKKQIKQLGKEKRFLLDRLLKFEEVSSDSDKRERDRELRESLRNEQRDSDRSDRGERSDKERSGKGRKSNGRLGGQMHTRPPGPGSKTSPDRYSSDLAQSPPTPTTPVVVTPQQPSPQVVANNNSSALATSTPPAGTAPLVAVEGYCQAYGKDRLCKSKALPNCMYCWHHAPLDPNSGFQWCKYVANNKKNSKKCNIPVLKSKNQLYCGYHQSKTNGTPSSKSSDVEQTSDTDHHQEKQRKRPKSSVPPEPKVVANAPLSPSSDKATNAMMMMLDMDKYDREIKQERDRVSEHQQQHNNGNKPLKFSSKQEVGLLSGSMKLTALDDLTNGNHDDNDRILSGNEREMEIDIEGDSDHSSPEVRKYIRDSLSDKGPLLLEQSAKFFAEVPDGLKDNYKRLQECIEMERRDSDTIQELTKYTGLDSIGQRDIQGAMKRLEANEMTNNPKLLQLMIRCVKNVDNGVLPTESTEMIQDSSSCNSIMTLDDEVLEEVDNNNNSCRRTSRRFSPNDPTIQEVMVKLGYLNQAFEWRKLWVQRCDDKQRDLEKQLRKVDSKERKNRAMEEVQIKAMQAKREAQIQKHQQKMEALERKLAEKREKIRDARDIVHYRYITKICVTVYLVLCIYRAFNGFIEPFRTLAGSCFQIQLPLYRLSMQ